MPIATYVSVFRALMALLLLTSCLTTPRTMAAELQPTAAPTDFAKLRDELTAGILNFEPEEMRMLGSPEAAGRLKDWSPAGVRAEVEFCQEALKRLKASQATSPSEKLDREVLTAHLTYLEYFYGQYHGALGNLQSSAYPYDVIQYELQRASTGKQDAASTLNHFDAIRDILRRLPEYLRQQESNLLAGLRLRQPDREILRALLGRIGAPEDPDSIRGGLKGLAESLGSEKIRTLLPRPLVVELRPSEACGFGLRPARGLPQNRTPAEGDQLVGARQERV